MFRRPSLAALMVLALLGGSCSSPATPVMVRPLAHGVFVASPDTPEDAVPEAQLAAYTAATGGKALAYVYLTNNWFYSRQFPAEVVRRVQARGATPVVRLMLRSSDEEASGPDPLYTLARIADGTFDPDLRAWASGAARAGGVIYAEYGTEVNGDWFGWNARWNGQAAGAALFVRAYRHLAHVVADAGADNVRWVFHVAAEDDPQQDWNRLEAYYPGGDLISVLGVSAYGAQTPQDDPIQSLRVQLDRVVPRLNRLAPGKPLLLLEFGSAAGAAVAPEAWAEAALHDLLSGRWPSVRGFSWWNSAWPNDDDPSHDTELRLERQPAVAAVFRKALVSPRVSQTLDLSP